MLCTEYMFYFVLSLVIPGTVRRFSSFEVGILYHGVTVHALEK